MPTCTLFLPYSGVFTDGRRLPRRSRFSTNPNLELAKRPVLRSAFLFRQRQTKVGLAMHFAHLLRHLPQTGRIQWHISWPSVMLTSFQENMQIWAFAKKSTHPHARIYYRYYELVLKGEKFNARSWVEFFFFRIELSSGKMWNSIRGLTRILFPLGLSHPSG